MIYIMIIQCQIIFEEFRMTSSDKNIVSSYEVYRSKYLDWISFYKTYHIFTVFNDFILTSFSVNDNFFE